MNSVTEIVETGTRKYSDVTVTRNSASRENNARRLALSLSLTHTHKHIRYYESCN
jgi:hypothetical protein